MTLDALQEWVDDQIREQLGEHQIRLWESGLGKHMGHIHENRALKFSEILEIFKQATNGELKSVTEKLDGQNMFVTYNVGIGELRFARNKGMIKSGGIDGQGVAAKWENLPNVRDAFSNAYNSLNKAFAGISPKKLLKIFGPQGNIWYSIEVVSTFNPNVIDYNQNAIIFHKVSLIIDQEGNVVNNDNFEQEFGFLQNITAELQSNVADTKWKIMGPLVMQLKKATSDALYQKHAVALMKEAKKYKLGASATIGDYLGVKFASTLPKTVDRKTRAQLGKIFGSSTMTAGQRKKEAEAIMGKDAAAQYFLVKGAQKTENALILPLEKIIYSFAVDVLEGVHSAVALNPEEEVQRLRGAVKKQVELIKNSGDEAAMAILNRALKKLKNIDQITSSMEGIVFKFGDRTYKLTGTFSPVNQILGLFRF